MAITVTEKPDSRASSSGDSQSNKLTYIICGSTDDLQVRAALEAAAPSVYDGLVRRSCAIKAVDADGGWWEGEVGYGPAKSLPRPKTGDKVLTFEIGGGTTRMYQSIQTVASYVAAGVTEEDFQGAIGVTQDAVEGVDALSGALAFTITHYKPASEVTAEWIAAAYALAAPPHVNEGTWSVTCTRPEIVLSFAEAEVLLVGVSGGPRSDDDYELAFKFAASPNKTDLTVGGITGIEKRGHEYLWVRYADAKGEKALVKKPIQVNVEQIYYKGDFSALGL